MRHAFAFLAFVALAGCEETNTYVEPPPPKVSVAQPLVEDIIDYLEMTGRGHHRLSGDDGLDGALGPGRRPRAGIR
jgi:hypothetical protein